VLVACAALRTNLTMRELAAVFRISKSAAHRIVTTMTPQIS
jgi:DNA-binding IclR family transcriptional regulator